MKPLGTTSTGRASRLRLLAPIVLVATLLSVGVSWARTSGSGQINACVGPSGYVRIVRDGVACRSNETPLVWSVQGPPGPPGPSQSIETHSRYAVQEIAPSDTGIIVARCLRGEIVTGGGFSSTSQAASFTQSVPSGDAAWVAVATNQSSVFSIDAAAWAICIPTIPSA